MAYRTRQLVDLAREIEGPVLFGWLVGKEVTKHNKGKAIMVEDLEEDLPHALKDLDGDILGCREGDGGLSGVAGE